MTQQHAPSLEDLETIERLGQTHQAVATVLDSCFGNLRVLRTAINLHKTAAQKAKNQASDSIAPPTDRRADTHLLDETVTLTARLRANAEKMADTIASLGMDSVEVLELRNLCDRYVSSFAKIDASIVRDDPEVPQTGDQASELTVVQVDLNRKATIHVTRLVALMQSRDAIDQRISHILEGFELMRSFDPASRTMARRIIKAQVQSIADLLTDISRKGDDAACNVDALSASGLLDIPSTDPVHEAIFCESVQAARSNWTNLKDKWDKMANQAGSDSAVSSSLSVAMADSIGDAQSQWDIVSEKLDTISTNARDRDSTVGLQLKSVCDNSSALSQGFTKLHGFAMVFDGLTDRFDDHAADDLALQSDTDSIRRIADLYTMDEEREVHNNILHQSAA